MVAMPGFDPIEFYTAPHIYAGAGVGWSRILCEMAQNNAEAPPRGRGRPRAYDPDIALARAREAFWRGGHAGTSLDDIAAATGMNRPSLYAAFGDKRALYLKALAAYWELSFAALRAPLAEDLPLDDALMRVFDGALSIYFSADGPQLGCFVVGTAVTEAVGDADIRQSIAAGIHTFDACFEARFRAALAKGELKPGADPAALALLASATLHSIAIRARAGLPRAALHDIARKAVTAICA
jgi:AcrR family transcriptional regulator